jgi:hypothetical protein
MSFELDGYIDCKTRITRFYELHPNGRIITELPIPVPGRDDMIMLMAKAYRNAEDTEPAATGIAAELVKGTTTFTRNSEVMNLETSAVGRCIANLGIGIEKSIASREEVARAKAPAVKAVEPVQDPVQIVQEAVDAWGLPLPPGFEEEGGPSCAHGERTYKTGTSKAGKAWAAFMCPVKECHPIWA